MADAADHEKQLRDRSPLRVLGVLAGLVLLLLLLWRIVDALLVLFAAILLAIFLDGLARPFSRYLGLGHPAALVMAMLVLAGFFVGAVLLAGPQIDRQLGALEDVLPQAIESIREVLRGLSWGRALLYTPPDTSDLVSGTGNLIGQMKGVFSATVDVAVKLPIVLIGGIYFAATPQRYVRGLLLLVPAPRRPRAREVLQGLGNALRWWLIGQLASMAVVGVLTGVGLWLIGSEMALALGLITGLLSFVPMLGPLLAAIPALLVGLMDGPVQMLYVGLVYVVAQLLEGNLITPLIQQRMVTLLPGVLIMAQLALGLALGFTAVLLAAPLTVAVVVLVQMLYVHDVLGTDVRVLGER
jgi:predicted PurR-regulated permease PerM